MSLDNLEISYRTLLLFKYFPLKWSSGKTKESHLIFLIQRLKVFLWQIYDDSFSVSASENNYIDEPHRMIQTANIKKFPFTIF